MTDDAHLDIDVHVSADSQAARLATLHELDAVPKEALRELVEEWRDNIVMTGYDREIAQRNRTFAECADELEARL